MTIGRRRFLQLAAAAAIPVAPGVGHAQGYPARTVRIIVATAAGGTTDIAARVLAQRLTEKLGQPFVVENRTGGGNNIGTEMAARSPADGYTLFMANSVNTINTTLYKNLNYNFSTDLAPVAIVMRSPLLMMVHPSVPAKTLSEFIALAKPKPGSLNLGSGGVGSTGHLSAELFMMMSGVKLTHVPYRGEAPAVTDLLAGQVQVLFATIGSAIQYVKAGKLRPLAITTAARSDILPDIPPIKDVLPGYEATSWNGLTAPAKTPAAIVNQLNTEINAALAEPVIKARFIDLGAPPIIASSEEFGRLIAEETEMWAKVIRFSGATAG